MIKEEKGTVQFFEDFKFIAKVEARYSKTVRPFLCKICCHMPYAIMPLNFNQSISTGIPTPFLD